MADLDNVKRLPIPKKRLKQPWASDPFEIDLDGGNPSDVEKEAVFADYSKENIYYYSDYSSSSSRSTSETYEHLLAPGTIKQAASAYADRTPQKRFNRRFSIALGSILVIFILALTILGSTGPTKFPDSEPKPYVWEQFPFLKRYHGGIRTLILRKENKPEYPCDQEEQLEALKNITLKDGNDPSKREAESGSDEYHIPSSKPFDPFNERQQYPPIVECFLDADSRIRVPKLQAYNGMVRGFPDNIIGSFDLLNINGDVCFDRFGRLGPYGFGYSRKHGGTGAGMDGDTEGANVVWEEDPECDYKDIKWDRAQKDCAEANLHRFRRRTSSFYGDNEVDSSSSKGTPNTGHDHGKTLEPLLNQTVVLVRTWHTYKYDPEDIMYLRALISELSLASGGEIQVHFLIHVQDNDLSIWSDEKVYSRVLKDALPEEFQGMGTLWSERQMQLVYGGLDESLYRDIGVYSNYRSMFMPVQYFAHKHPEFEFFWNWPMDARYTGHYYHLFDRVGAWAKKQPRKGLWERNSRFYIPFEHGTWEDFRQMVRVQTEHGTNTKSNVFSGTFGNPAKDLNSKQKTVEKPIWGPEPPEWDEIVNGTSLYPPTSYDKDHYEWGVGEEADLITFNPLFDPQDTGWNLETDVVGYNTTNGQYPPRRAAIVTASRLSKRLLDTMHRETSNHRHTMFSEMWPASCALHHGMKAVYAPHPVYIDRRWPTDYLAAIFNAGRNGATGGSRMSVFNDDHNHNLLGITWDYRAGFPENLWKRWLGYKVDNDGGEVWEMSHEGRMCLPAMLLHPVKQINLVFEHRAKDEE